MLMMSYYDTIWWTGFFIGTVAGGFLTIIALVLWVLYDDDRAKKEKEKEKAEFEAWKKSKKQKLPEVVDAQFVVTPNPQLSNSTALVKRSTSLERR